MPDSRMIQKAGKLSFLLVCLFLCTACKNEKAVFEAGAVPAVIQEQDEIQEAEETTETEIPDKEEMITNPLVNINTANAEELMTLPGIGQTRAEAILDYREIIGSFEKIEDIMNVKGIKTGIFSKISSLITVK